MKEVDSKTEKGRVWSSAFGKLMKEKGIRRDEERGLCFWGLLCRGIEYCKRGELFRALNVLYVMDLN